MKRRAARGAGTPPELTAVHGLIYLEKMENITFAIDADVLAKAQRVAAEKDTTVNAMVRDYLTRIANQDTRAARARQRLLKLSTETAWDPGSDWMWSREGLYDRDVLHRHERADLRGVEPPAGDEEKAGGVMLAAPLLTKFAGSVFTREGSPRR